MLSRLRISTCDYFIGVLFTGQMTENVVKSALKRINYFYQHDPVVEILFHPGGANIGEEELWNNNEKLSEYYYSSWRFKENQTIKSESFIEFINSYNLQ